MGSTALLRQTYFDAHWYEAASKRDLAGGTNLSLEAFNNTQQLPQFFSAGGWKDVLRADAIADEFSVNYTILGGGDSYQRAEAVAETGATIASPQDMLRADVDVVCPCALGGVLTPEVAGDLRAWAVCGAANNILSDANAEAVLLRIQQRGRQPAYVAVRLR